MANTSRDASTSKQGQEAGRGIGSPITNEAYNVITALQAKLEGLEAYRKYAKDGSEDLKIIPSCTLPLTGVGVVDRIITDLGVFDVVPGGIKLVELAEGVSREQAQSKTGVPLL